MNKPALIVISSLLFALAGAPVAWAKSAPADTDVHEKVLVKKPVAAQSKSSARHAVHVKTASRKHAAPKIARGSAKSGARTTTTLAANGSLNKQETLVKQTIVAHGKRRVVYRRVTARPSVAVVPPIMTAGDLAGLNLTQDPLALRSNVAYVMDQASSQVLFEKNGSVPLPIASVTKLMTALVVVEAHQDMNEVLAVTDEDVDREKFSHSRLGVGSKLSRDDMLHIALMSSENRAASSLGRNFPGGLPAFVATMNAKAKSLGMHDTHYNDSTGLNKTNVASAHDLAKLVVAAYQYPIIRQYSTDPKYMVEPGGHVMQYSTSNSLVKKKDWDIGLQKTGYINEAGHCLVMQTRIDGRPVVMVFLDSKGSQSHLADAGRMRQWLSSHAQQNVTHMVSKAD
jgi:D-alanyl-D-alanine endopeptidase (penicillin-binding protein 7)